MNYMALLILTFSIGFSAGMPTTANAEMMDRQTPSVMPMTMAHSGDKVMAPQAGYENFIAPVYAASEAMNQSFNQYISTNLEASERYRASITNISPAPENFSYNPVRTEE